jgi:hypothetical protein
MTSIRTAFAEVFGDDQAAAIVAAAEAHQNGVHDDRGSDAFKWALCITIGHECFTHDSYRAHHGITADADAIRAWIKEFADLGTHDGDMDYLAAMCGAYDEYLPAAGAEATR